MEKRVLFQKRTMETREAENDELIIRGYFCVFDEITDRVGYFKEKVDKNAFEGVDTSETLLLVGHDFNNLLGRSGVNLDIGFDENGGYMECRLDKNCEYDKLIYNRIQRGILDGMSFGFTIDELATDYENKIDTILRIGKLYEITLTPIPAYPQTVATAVEREQKNRIDQLLEEIKEM